MFFYCRTLQISTGQFARFADGSAVVKVMDLIIIFNKAKKLLSKEVIFQ